MKRIFMSLVLIFVNSYALASSAASGKGTDNSLTAASVNTKKNAEPTSATATAASSTTAVAITKKTKCGATLTINKDGNELDVIYPHPQITGATVVLRKIRPQSPEPTMFLHEHELTLAGDSKGKTAEATAFYTAAQTLVEAYVATNASSALVRGFKIYDDNSMSEMTTKDSPH